MSSKALFFDAEECDDAIEVFDTVVVDLDAAFFVGVMEADVGVEVADELLFDGFDGRGELGFGDFGLWWRRIEDALDEFFGGADG